MILNSRVTKNPSIIKDVNVYSTKLFIYDKKTKTFITEVSDLPCKGKPFYQIFNDACDYGFWMESERTGDLMLFLYEGADKSSDEIVGWRLKSEEGFNALVIND
jgi:hypothetical protein